MYIYITEDKTLLTDHIRDETVIRQHSPEVKLHPLSKDFIIRHFMNHFVEIDFYKRYCIPKARLLVKDKRIVFINDKAFKFSYLELTDVYHDEQEVLTESPRILVKLVFRVVLDDASTCLAVFTDFLTIDYFKRLLNEKPEYVKLPDKRILAKKFRPLHEALRNTLDFSDFLELYDHLRSDNDFDIVYDISHSSISFGIRKYGKIFDNLGSYLWYVEHALNRILE